MALVALFLAVAGGRAQEAGQAIATQTTLSVDPDNGAARTVTVDVVGADGSAGSGIVNVMDGARQLDEVVLNSEGEATATVKLPRGEHSLRAIYVGSKSYQASTSDSAQVHTDTSTGSTPDFQLSVAAVSPATLPLTLTAGQSGSVTVTVTPVNNAALSAPMYVTLSCSGLPSLASCSFAPEVVQILPSTPSSCASGSPASACPPTSLMEIQTEGQGTGGTPVPPADAPVKTAALGFLLPGVLGLGGIAWGARRRRWLQRMALLALVGMVTMLGTTACNPFYYYYNHGPAATPPTPSGTYTVTVTAQSSDGVTAITNNTTLALTVQ